ncbi:MAG: hypothetical protein ACHQ6T_16850 [Myxococcota bacterium]
MFRMALGLLVALLLSNTAGAAPISYLWYGVVASPIEGLINRGDPLYLSYTFDADPSCPVYGCSGITHPQLLSGSLSVGPYTYTLSDPTALLIVDNDDPTFQGNTGTYDVYQVQFFQMEGPALNGMPPYFLQLVMVDGTHTAFPNSTLDLNKFQGPSGYGLPRTFNFFFGAQGADALASGGLWNVTIVPEPGAQALACMALVALIFGRVTRSSTH